MLRSTPGWAASDPARALKEAFLGLDVQLSQACPSSSGTTCTLAVLQGDRVAVGGVGDSKWVPSGRGGARCCRGEGWHASCTCNV